MPLPDSPYPTEVPCTKAEILETLHNWIILMQMKPGEKISDTELADYFHVSRTPVREVLKILEQQKLILTYPGKATVVADLDLDKIESYYLPMQTLQCLAVRLAVDLATNEDIDELEHRNLIFRRMAADNNTEGLLMADHAFHEKILAIAGNAYIQEFCSALWVPIARLDYLFFRDNHMASSAQDHRTIIDSFRIRRSVRRGAGHEKQLELLHAGCGSVGQHIRIRALTRRTAAPLKKTSGRDAGGFSVFAAVL